MTNQAERIREAHRGWRAAEPASASRLKSLAHHGLRVVLLDDATAMVEDEFQFNLIGGHWRSTIDSACHGYLVIGIITEIRRRSSVLQAVAAEVPHGTTAIMIDTFHLGKPAPGRDSDATGDRTADSTTASTVAIAESGAGTSSRLPAVWP